MSSNLRCPQVTLNSIQILVDFSPRNLDEGQKAKFVEFLAGSPSIHDATLASSELRATFLVEKRPGSQLTRHPRRRRENPPTFIWHETSTACRLAMRDTSFRVWAGELETSFRNVACPIRIEIPFGSVRTERREERKMANSPPPLALVIQDRPPANQEIRPLHPCGCRKPSGCAAALHHSDYRRNWGRQGAFGQPFTATVHARISLRSNQLWCHPRISYGFSSLATPKGLTMQTVNTPA